jgi:IclR family transcriptional regulator, acetate operon repressor
MTRVVERSVALLRALRAEGAPLRLQALARAADVDPSTARRLLATLATYELVEFDPESKTYSLGFGLLELASGLWREEGILAAARPRLERLRDETECTSTLEVRSGLDRVTMVVCDSTGTLKPRYRVGERAPLYSGATGLAILAHSAPEVVNGVLSRLSHDDAEGIPSRDDVLASLQRVAETGTSFTSGQRVAGVAALAAPVFESPGRAWGAVGLLAADVEEQRDDEGYRWSDDSKAALRRCSHDIARLLFFATDMTRGASVGGAGTDEVSA